MTASQPRFAQPRLLAALLIGWSLELPLRSAHGQTVQTPSAAAGAESLLREVTVTGEAVSADEERQESATTKIIFERNDIEKIDAVTVSDLLRALPGVNLSLPPTDGRRGRSGPSDRLMPRIVVDGEPLGGPGGASATLRLPTELIERIEIIRNSTAEFPAGPGGTVNLILREVPPEKTTTTKLSASSDGQGLGGRANAVYGNREGVAGTILTLSVDRSPQTRKRRSLEQQFSRTPVDAVAVEEQTGSSLGLYFISRFTRDLGAGERLIISPMFYGSEREQETSTTLTGATTGRESDRDDVTRAGVRLSGEWKKRYAGAGEGSLRATLHAHESRASGQFMRFDANGVKTVDSTTRAEIQSKGLGLAAKRSLPLGADHLGTFGLNVRHRSQDEQRNTALKDESSERNVAIWGQDEWQLSKAHTLTPGLRIESIDNRTLTTLGQTNSISATNLLPSLHWVWRVDGTMNLRASVAQTQSQPGVSQITSVITESTGTNSLVNPDRAGNPSLRPERTTTLQLGLERFLKDKRGSGGLNLFVRDTRDKILNQTLEETVLGATRFVVRPVNAASARDISLVLDFKLKPKAIQRLDLQGNVSANQLEVQDLSGGSVRRETPRKAASLRADYKLAQQKTSLGGSLSWNSSFDRESFGDTLVTVASTHQIDVYAVYRLNPSSNIRLSLSNLTAPDTKTTSQRSTAGVVQSRVTSTSEGVRMVMLTLERKW
ncbi:MAG: TonB-dependent receptor [Burkholderiaceae bacterium]|nr:TonB-dependent receptor [Burkholderiaceae bacterium]